MEDAIWDAILAYIPEVTRQGRKIQSAGECGPEEYEEWKLNQDFVDGALYDRIIPHLQAIAAEVKKVELYSEIYHDSDEWMRDD